MNIVDAPVFAPGCCYVCECTPKGPYIDLERDDPDNDRIYLCMACLNEAVRIVLDSGAEVRQQFVARVKELKQDTPVASQEVVGDMEMVAEGRYTCPLCGKGFDSQNALNGHTTGHKRRGEWTE